MVQIKDTLVSDELFTRKFVCDLAKCKGICCVEGDSGAPVDENEKAEMERALPSVMPYMSEKGRRAVASQGAWIHDPYDRSPVTPLVEGKECAYLVTNADGVSLCAFEQAFRDGKTRFKKPVSCHLYPIRLSSIMSFTALNYHRWDICSDACALGEKLGIPLYKFLREPLVRRFGRDWYEELCLTADEYLKRYNH